MHPPEFNVTTPTWTPGLSLLVCQCPGQSQEFVDSINVFMSVSSPQRFSQGAPDWSFYSQFQGLHSTGSSKCVSQR